MGGPHWSPDGRLLYYNTLPDLPVSDPSRWLQAVMVRHEIGKPASSDLALSKPSLDGGKLQFGQVSHDGRHFFSTVGITGNADTPVFWKRLDASGDLVLIGTGLGVGRHSVIDIVGLRLIMVTTAGAANGRVVTLDLNQRDSGWQVLVPEQSAASSRGPRSSAVDWSSPTLVTPRVRLDRAARCIRPPEAVVTPRGRFRARPRHRHR